MTIAHSLPPGVTGNKQQWHYKVGALSPVSFLTTTICISTYAYIHPAQVGQYRCSSRKHGTTEQNCIAMSNPYTVQDTQPGRRQGDSSALNHPHNSKGTHLINGHLYSSLISHLIMVVFTCSDEECGRVFHQEPAYIKHMLKHRKFDLALR